MRGKYSPTVSAAYEADQSWFKEYAYGYDKEGYDSYGYDKDDIDRAGNREHMYYTNEDLNNAYEDALRAWGFDGVSPILLSSNDIPGKGSENSWFSDEACLGMTIEFPNEDNE